MVPNGLAAWYRFEETEGPLVIDATGHGHNGMISGSSQRMPGKVGMGLRPTTAFVRAPADPGIDFVTAGTVEVWLQVPPSTIGGGVFNVLSRGTGNNDNLVSFNSSCGNIQSIFQHTSSPPVGVTAPTTNLATTSSAIRGSTSLSRTMTRARRSTSMGSRSRPAPAASSARRPRTSSWEANRAALHYGSRLLSSYEIGNQKLWIITEADSQQHHRSTA